MNWNSVSIPFVTNFQGIACSASGQYAVVGAYAAGLFVSSNYGEDWDNTFTYSTSDTCSGSCQCTSIAMSESGQFVIASCSQVGGGYAFETSNSYGAEWVNIPATPSSGTYAYSLALNSTGQQVLQCTPSGVSISTNYGTLFSTVSSVSCYSAASSSSGMYLSFLQKSGDVYVSSDRGKTFTAVGISSSVYYGSTALTGVSMDYTGQNMVAVGEPTGQPYDTWTSSNYGETWVNNQQSNVVNYIGVDLAGNDDFGVALGITGGIYTGIYTSNNYGTTFSESYNTLCATNSFSSQSIAVSSDGSRAFVIYCYTTLFIGTPTSSSSDSSSGLSAGEAAGVAIGVIAAVVLIAVAVWFFFFYNRPKPTLASQQV